MFKFKLPRLRLWVGIGLLAVITMWSVSAAANFMAGYSLAKTEGMGLILGGASVSADVMKAISFFVIASAFYHKKWLACGCAVLVFTLCSAWSLRSATHFASTILTDNMQAKAMASAVQKSELDLLNIQTSRASFLAQQRVDVAPVDVRRRASADTLRNVAELNQSAAKEYVDAVNAVKTAQSKLKTEEVVMPKDPLATLLQVDDMTVLTATALFFAFLVEVISGVGFWLIAQARTPRVYPKTEAVRQDQDEAPAVRLEETPMTAKPVLIEQARDNVVAIRPPAANPEDLPGQMKQVVSNFQREQIKRAMADIVDLGSPDDRVRLGTLWDLVNQRLPKGARLLTSRHMLEAMTALGWDTSSKQKIGGQIWIMGIKMKAIRAVA